MKFIKWFGNPYVFVSLYLLLIIEGENFGGFYLLYLLLAIQHGLLYSILSVAGIALLIGGTVTRRYYKPLLMLAGIVVMIAALFVFFSRGNKQETFALGIPLFTFTICAASGISLFFSHRLYKLSPPKT